MTWTYHGSTQNKDIVRMLCGQTSSGDDVLLTDEHVEWMLTQRANVTGAAAYAAKALSARYASNPTAESIGELGLTWGDRAKGYRETAAMLEKEALRGGGVTFYVGGRSISDKRTDEIDRDRFGPQFFLGQHDNPAIGTASTGST